MYHVILLSGNEYDIDANEHSIEAAMTNVVSPSSPEIVRFWETNGVRGTRNRELVAAIPLSHIEIIMRA
jgi:hypothetical protein